MNRRDDYQAKKERLNRATRDQGKTFVMILPGQTWRDKISDVRVMTIVEGWIVARRKGRVPLLRHENDFRDQFEFIPDSSSSNG